MAAPNLNPRQLRFVTEWLKHGNASRAYRSAGYQPSTKGTVEACSSRLLSHARVKAEIERRQQAMIKRADITLDSLLADLAADRALARQLDQPSAAIAATQLTAKLCGLLVERKESGAPGDFAAARTEADVISAVRAELGDKAAELLQAIVSADETPLATVEPASEARH